MVYNGNTDGQDIVSTIADSTGMNKIADLKRITRAANEATRLIWAWIFESYGGWQYDDGNQTTLSSAKAPLAASQSKYTIPSDAISIRQVSVQDTSGQFYDLTPITTEEIHSRSTETEFQDTAGRPRYYRLISNVIELYPAPNYSQPTSLRVQFDRGSVAFASTDSTKSPGFVSEFHGAVPVGASYIIASDRSLSNRGNLGQRWLQYREDIQDYYKARFVELNPTEVLTERHDPLTNLH